MNNYEIGQKLFERKVDANDIDLVAMVRGALEEKGLIPEVAQYFNPHHYIVCAEGKNSEVQRYYLNMYWTLQLIASKKECTAERMCLVNKGEPVDWIVLFKTKILPFIIENNLPRQL